MNNETVNIKIKYFDKEIDKIKKIEIGDWIDLRAAETTILFMNTRTMIPLGVGMKLPEGYEAIIAPRSSLQKKGVIMGNSIGVIDNSYCGNDDQWHFPAILVAEPKGGFKDKAMTYMGEEKPYITIEKNERICQFRIQKIQPKINFIEVDNLDEVSRGGLGSTGKFDIKSIIDEKRQEGPITMRPINAHSDYHILPDEDIKRLAAESNIITGATSTSIVTYKDGNGNVINTGLSVEDLTDMIITNKHKVKSTTDVFDYKNIQPGDTYTFGNGDTCTYYELYTEINKYKSEIEDKEHFANLRDLIIKGVIKIESKECIGDYIREGLKDC